MNQMFNGLGGVNTDILSMNMQKTTNFWYKIDGENILKVDFNGNSEVIGKSLQSYTELENVCTEYYEKLVELGVIEPVKTAEEIAKETAEQTQAALNETQNTMAQMANLMKALQDEIKEIKEANKNVKHECACANGAENGSESKNKRGSKTSESNDTGNDR